MSWIKFNFEIMQCCTGTKDMTDKIAGSESAFVFNCPHSFDAADGMFYPYSKRSDLPVILFLFPGKASSFGLFYRLFNDRILRPESLISRILIQDAGRGKRVHGISCLFVMHLPANAWTDRANAS
jgi:hypothetical protein